MRCVEMYAGAGGLALALSRAGFEHLLLVDSDKACIKTLKTNGFNKWGNKECIEHLPDTNFWHYSLQLNVYKALLERKYNMTIDGLYLVCLHPNNKNKNYIKLKAPDLQEEVNCLFALRLLDLDITI